MHAVHTAKITRSYSVALYNVAICVSLQQVVRRPYVFIFRDERDPVERGLINLMTAQIEYSEHQEAMLRVPNSFRFERRQKKKYSSNTSNLKAIYFIFEIFSYMLD